jgi:hypothetical protein
MHASPPLPAIGSLACAACTRILSFCCHCWPHLMAQPVSWAGRVLPCGRPLPLQAAGSKPHLSAGSSPTRPQRVQQLQADVAPRAQQRPHPRQVLTPARHRLLHSAAAAHADSQHPATALIAVNCTHAQAVWAKYGQRLETGACWGDSRRSALSGKVQGSLALMGLTWRCAPRGAGWG